jgi:hypothetical protein
MPHPSVCRHVWSRVDEDSAIHRCLRCDTPALACPRCGGSGSGSGSVPVAVPGREPKAWETDDCPRCKGMGLLKLVLEGSEADRADAVERLPEMGERNHD